MAAFVLFVVAVAGGGVAADLALENPTAGQVTVFGQTVGGYPEGWLLAAAAGLGFVVALVLVASVNSTKGRGRRKQLAGLRQGLQDQVVAAEPNHARLLDGFFGPEEPSHHLGGPARPVELKSEGRERPAGDYRRWVTPRPIQHPTEPLYQQVRSAHVREAAWEGRAEDDPRWVTGERVECPPSRSMSRPGGPLGWARTGTSRLRPARGAGGSGARRGWRRQAAAGDTSVACGAIGLTAPG
jgi:hypothetical protein